MTRLVLSGPRAAKAKCGFSRHPQTVPAFSLGVTAVKAQTSQAFQGVTDLTSDAIIDFAARQPTLKEANLTKTILTEMQELLHRIDVVQGLLFRETSNALDKTLDKINDANQKLAKAIKSVEDVAGLLKSASEFLKFVDKAIDIAKTLAVVA